jgi:hypothetical protein
MPSLGLQAIKTYYMGLNKIGDEMFLLIQVGQ